MMVCSKTLDFIGFPGMSSEITMTIPNPCAGCSSHPRGANSIYLCPSIPYLKISILSYILAYKLLN